jgi:ketosteroid isomerase-like protein
MSETIAEHQRKDVEQLYAAFNRRDVEAVLERLSSNVTWANGMEGGHVEGRAAVRSYWARQFELVQATVEPERIALEPDGRVAVDVHQVVRTPDGELLANQRVRHLFTFDDDLITRFDIEE